MSAPLPSPAPTLDPHFPGIYPESVASTPMSEQPPPLDEPQVDAPADEQAQDQDALLARAALEPVTSLPSTLDKAEAAIAGAAAGLAAKVGQLAGVPAPAVDGIDDLTRNLEPSSGDTLHHDNKGTDGDSPASAKTLTLQDAPTTAAADETHRPEFGLDAVRKEQDDLAASPAQRLVAEGTDNDDDNRANDGAKLAAGAGAVGGAALLAGAAGAKINDNEVREPTLADDSADRKGLVEPTDAPAASTPTAPDFGTPAIEKEQAALAASPAQQLLRTDTASSTSAVQADEAALLAGAAGAKVGGTNEVEEPARAPLDVVTEKAVDAGAGVPTSPQSEGAHAVALEREISEPVAPQSTSNSNSEAADRPSLPTPHGSTTSFSADVLAAGEGIHTPTEAPGPAAAGFGVRDGGEIVATDHELGDEPRGGREEAVVHNPSPVLPAAAAVAGGAAAGTALTGNDNAPRDFQPYTPPVAEPSQASRELKQAAAVPVPETPATELTPVDSRSTSNTVMPGTGAGILDASATSVPETLNAQNLDTSAPPAAAQGPTTPGSQQIELEEALDEGPDGAVGKKDKGKGKEVLGAAALGTAGVGAGVGMKELLDGDRDASRVTHGDSLMDQRAYPTVPHMLDSKPDTTGVDGAPRALDPAQLAAGSAATDDVATAGPTVAAGAPGVTPAMQDIAHLSSESAPQPVVEQPISAEQYEDQKDEHSKAPLVGAGLAGAGAGAAGAALLTSREREDGPLPAIGTGAPTALSPAAAAPSAATAVPVEQPAAQPAVALTSNQPEVPTAAAAAPAVRAAGAPAAGEQPVDKRTPVSRFTEETFTPSATGAETPSSTRAVMGSPPNSAAATPVQATTPTQSLFEAGILEKSPHMKIQTHKVDGHKRLHRKSLSGVVGPGGSISRHSRAGSAAGGSPRGSVETERAPVVGAAAPAAVMAAPPAAAAAAHHPHHQPQHQRAQMVNQEGRRDRMVDNMVGVHDPTVGGYDAAGYTSTPSSPSRHNTGVAQTYAGLPPTGHATGAYAPGPIAPGPGAAVAPAPVQQHAAQQHAPAVQAVAHPQAHPQALSRAPSQAHPHAQPIPTGSHVTTSVDSHGHPHRKLQKKHVPPGVAASVAPGAVQQHEQQRAATPDKGSGFFSRVFGGGSK